MEKQTSELFDDAIKALNNIRNESRKAIESSEEDNKPDENPSFVLFDRIVESSIGILKSPDISSLFGTVAEKVGEDTAKALIEAFAISMSHSAYEASVFYDALLKKELDKQFNNIESYINNLIGTVKAHSAVLEVNKKEINDIKHKLMIEDFKKQV